MGSMNSLKRRYEPAVVVVEPKPKRKGELPEGEFLVPEKFFVDPDPGVVYPRKFFIDWPAAPAYLEARESEGRPRKRHLHNALRVAVKGSSAAILREARKKIKLNKRKMANSYGVGSPGWRYKEKVASGPGSPGWRYDPYNHEETA